MDFVIALGGLGALLLAGLLLRVRVRLLRRLLLPVSVVAGFVGLSLGPYALDLVPTEVVGVWTALPSVLINFVFAALFLGVTIPPFGELVRLGGPLCRFFAIASLGQYAVGLLLAWLVLTPLFGTPDLFGCILEVGFAGGHGTAAAMGPVFAELGFEAGGALGQMAATVGIVVAVTSGIALVQWGVRGGLAPEVGGRTGGVIVPDEPVLVPLEERQAAARSTVRPAALDTFTLHVAVVAVAVSLGWILQRGVHALHPALAGFPLFPLAMIGGMVIQVLAVRTGVHAYFDRPTFERILGFSLDFLIVAAVASLRLDLFLENVVPFSLLMVAGAAWTAVAFLFLAPRLMRTDWFEQSITAYGTATGVTAIGLMLLRIVDPQNRTTGAEAFAAGAIVFSPLFGGGLVTATIPLLVVRFGAPGVVLGTSAVAAALYAWPKGGRG